MYKRQISDNAHIQIQDPKALSYTMHATMSSAYEEGIGYVLRPGVEGEMPCLIIPNYKIETWEKNEIKQEIIIEIIPDKSSPKDAQKLLDHLSLKIKKKRKNKFLIDGNMNLKKMELINGFFRNDRNTFILEDGSKYNVRQLVIKSFLFIPKTSDVEFDTGYLGVEMGDLDGKLMINAEFGYIKTGNIKEIEANIQHLNADFKNVGQMTLNATYSEISAHAIGQLTIGSLELINKMPKKKDLFSYDRSQQSLSFSNKYKIDKIGSLKILDTGNDNFNLGSITNFKAINTSFSNFYIKKIEKKLDLTGKNGDLIVYALSSDFEELSIDNQTSTIELNMEQTPDYQVNIERQEKTELRFPTNLVKLSPSEDWSSSFYRGNPNKGGTIILNCTYCEVIIN